MRNIFLVSLFMLFTNISIGQIGRDTKELNWITKNEFQKDLINSIEITDKKSVVIYANVINTGNFDSTIKYISSKNATKNIYIFANKIVFTGKLYFKLNGFFDSTKETNPSRDGGNLVIYANTAEFLDESALHVETVGEYNTYWENLNFSTSNAALKKGGNGGSVYLIFDNLVFDDAKIISKALASLHKVFDEDSGIPNDLPDTSKTIEIGKKEFIQDLGEVKDVFGEDFYTTYRNRIEKKINEIKNELVKVNNWKEFNPISLKLYKDFLFDFMLIYVKEALSYSKDFSDLNLGTSSKFAKLFSYKFMKWGESIPDVAENFFISYQGTSGYDFQVDDRRVFVSNRNKLGSKLIYYNDLSTFLNLYPEYVDLAGKWIILLLKDIKLRLEKADKNSDYPGFITAINLYNSLPDVSVSKEDQIDTYSSLLKEINVLRDKYKNRIIPLRNNIIQQLQDGRVNYYVLPGFSLVKNYFSDSLEKLGLLQADVISKTMQINFSLQLIPDISEVEYGKQISLTNKGVFSGMYNDWAIDSYDLSYQGIDQDKSEFKKDGDNLNCKLLITEDNRLAFAMLFGTGNLFIHLNCHSNSDKDFKFSLSIPINFRYRQTNKIRFNIPNSIINWGDNDVVIYGFVASDNSFTKLNPLTISSKQVKQIERPIQSVPSELVENIMNIEFNKNYKYFENITGKKLSFRTIYFTNNFPNKTDANNYFQKISLDLKYSDGTANKEYHLTFSLPEEEQSLNIVFPFDNPTFIIKGKAFYENETIDIPETTIKSWNIILDQSLGHN